MLSADLGDIMEKGATTPVLPIEADTRGSRGRTQGRLHPAVIERCVKDTFRWMAQTYIAPPNRHVPEMPGEGSR